MNADGVKNYLLNGLNRSQVRAVTMVAYRGFFLGFFAWAVGLLGPFKMGEGFAYAGEMKQLEQQVQESKESVLAGRLDFLLARAFDLRILQCTAIAEHKSPQVYTIQLREVLKDYAELTKDPLMLPACEELT